MQPESPKEPLGGIRKLLPYTSIAVVLALLYVAWVFYSRWREHRDAEHAAVAAEAQADGKIVDEYGGGHLKILMLYADPGVAKRGEQILLCYGVANAKTVKIEPNVENVGPSLSRCVQATPRKDTTYTLTAQGRDGRTDTRSIVVQVEK